jgi:hypothetical protein
VDVKASEAITISRILDSAKKQYCEYLVNGSDFRTYSGSASDVLLSGSMVWDVKSHGGGSKAKGLLVKFTIQSDGTCRFVTTTCRCRRFM